MRCEEAERWMARADRRGERRPGGGLSGDAELLDRLARSRLFETKSRFTPKRGKDFAGLFVDDPEDFRIQPCLSPVWDTAINIIALAESGVSPEHPALQKPPDWLVNKEVRIRGDWAVNNPHPEASGWAFEYNNIYYPDTGRHGDGADGVAARYGRKIQQSLDELFRRALGWQLSFQCRDGGWAAFDKERHDAIGWKTCRLPITTRFSIRPAAT